MKKISMNLGIKLLGMIFILSLFGCGTHYLKFQNVKYRIGGANRAFIGAVGLLRTEGPNTFSIKYVPQWKNVKITKTGSIAKSIKDTLQFTGAVSIEGQGEATSNFEKKKTLSGKFTIYQIMDIKELVRELNSVENKDLRNDYLKLSKDFRIITSMITVEKHSESIEVNGVLSLTTTVDGVAKIMLKPDANARIKFETNYLESMSDNMIYAYEYGRIVWDSSKDGKKNGKIKDIMVDHPGGLLGWHFWDAKSPLKCAVSDPEDLKKKKCEE